MQAKVCIFKAMVFPAVMYGCESWTIKNAERRRIDAFELWCWRRPLRVSWTARRSNQSINARNQTRKSTLNIHWKNWCWSSISWPSDTKSQLTRKDPDAGKDWRQKKKGATEDKIVAWYYWLNGYQFEQAPGVGDRQGNPDGQGSLVCWRPWDRKELDMTERLNCNCTVVCVNPMGFPGDNSVQYEDLYCSFFCLCGFFFSFFSLYTLF